MDSFESIHLLKVYGKETFRDEKRYNLLKKTRQFLKISL